MLFLLVIRYFHRAVKSVKIVCHITIISPTYKKIFSTLRCLKTYLRLTLSQEHLNGLALANINKKEELVNDN